MRGMADAHPRSRRPAGQSGGGEFAPEAKHAPYGLSLSGPGSGDDPDPHRPETLTAEQTETIAHLSVDTPSSLRRAAYRAVGYAPVGDHPGLDDARCALDHRDEVDRVPGFDTETYVALSRPYRQATGQPLHPDDPPNLDLTSMSDADADLLADQFWPTPAPG